MRQSSTAYTPSHRRTTTLYLQLHLYVHLIAGMNELQLIGADDYDCKLPAIKTHLFLIFLELYAIKMRNKFEALCINLSTVCINSHIPYIYIYNICTISTYIHMSIYI